MFQLVNSKKLGDDDFACMDTTLSKWRQIMPENKLSSNGPDFMLGFGEKIMQTGKRNSHRKDQCRSTARSEQ